jgi:hypothetical protein
MKNPAKATLNESVKSSSYFEPPTSKNRSTGMVANWFMQPKIVPMTSFLKTDIAKNTTARNVNGTVMKSMPK